jgi:hypothetical protein
VAWVCPRAWPITAAAPRRICTGFPLDRRLLKGGGGPVVRGTIICGRPAAASGEPEARDQFRGADSEILSSQPFVPFTRYKIHDNITSYNLSYGPSGRLGANSFGEFDMSVFQCPVCHHVLQVSAHSPSQLSPSDSAASNGDPLQAKLLSLKRRCTRGRGRVWDLVKAVAARSQPCTLHELAADLSAPAKSILSWRRILGRCCHPKRLNLNVIGRTGEKYDMPADVRRIVAEVG